MTVRYSLIVAVFLIPSAVFAASVTIPDGTLASDTDDGNSVGVSFTQALAPSFGVADFPLTISGTLDPSNGTGNGSYGMGLTVGNRWFFFHPGFLNGAFRINGFTPATHTSFVIETNNQDMGFMPDGSPADFMIVLTDAGAGNYSAAVTITQGINVYNPASFTLAATTFGTAGAIETFGVHHNRFTAGAPVTTLDYSGVALPVQLQQFSIE